MKKILLVLSIFVFTSTTVLAHSGAVVKIALQESVVMQVRNLITVINSHSGPASFTFVALLY